MNSKFTEFKYKNTESKFKNNDQEQIRITIEVIADSVQKLKRSDINQLISEYKTQVGMARN
jgi:hypothetical protein